MKKMEVGDALKRAENLCASREKCTSDMRLMLRKWGISDDDQGKIIQKLVRNRFLDDARFAVIFSRDKQKFNKWGKEKIRFELRKKNLEEEIIESALSALNEEDGLVMLRSILIRKKKEIRSSNLYEMKAKLVKFGIQKGYTYDAVYRIVDELVKE
jgi:regulatory protein